MLIKQASHGLEGALRTRKAEVKSRKGSIPKNLHKHLHKVSMHSMMAEVSKLSEELPTSDSMTPNDVAEAMDKLRRPTAGKRIIRTATLAGVAAPMIEGAGRFAKGFVNAKGGLKSRAVGGMSSMKEMTKGDIASRALTAGLGGAALQSAGEGLELHRARKTMQEWLTRKKPPAPTLAPAPEKVAAAAIPGIKMPSVASFKPPTVHVPSTAPKIPTPGSIKDGLRTPSRTNAVLGTTTRPAALKAPPPGAGAIETVTTTPAAATAAAVTAAPRPGPAPGSR